MLPLTLILVEPRLDLRKKKTPLYKRFNHPILILLIFIILILIGSIFLAASEGPHYYIIQGA